MGTKRQLTILTMAKFLGMVAFFALAVQGDVEPGEMPTVVAEQQSTVENARIVGGAMPSHQGADPFVNTWDKSAKQQWDLEDKEEVDMQSDLSKLASDVNGFQSMMKNFRGEQKKIREHYEFKIRDMDSENQRLKKELDNAKKENGLLVESRNRVQQAMQLINGVSGVVGTK